MFYIGYIFYVLIWLFDIKWMGLLVGTAGYTYAIDDYFGIVFLNYYVAIKCILLFAPLIIRLVVLFIKNEKKKKRVLPFCWLVSIIVSILILCLDIFCTSKFRTFEPELWQQYPRQRNVMREDLENRNLLEGMTMDEVEAFLGKADCRASALWYETNVDGGKVFIKFKDNVFESIDWF